ncbi:MAG: hypothetical protein L0Y71_06590 [Gemmataceae bacterium]|nr:hypothetical protein [Gemmataceae bacterium]
MNHQATKDRAMNDQAMKDRAMNDQAMNDTPRPAVPTVQVGPIHYQILCGAGLLLMALAQFDQGMFLGNLLVACIGLLGILSKTRVGPILVLLGFAAAQIAFHRLRFGDRDDVRPLLDLRDLLLAVGLLIYITANYRLQGLWLQILPIDARQRQAQRTESGLLTFERIEQKRASRLLTPPEIARFVLAVPLVAIASQFLWLVVARRWELAVFPERFLRLVNLAWLTVVGMLVVGAIFTHWRRRQMDGAAAQVCLEDTLWRETRREQRRIFRWLAWRRLHERTAAQTQP